MTGRRLLALILDLMFVAVWLAVVFRNPAQTQTQLFIAYWWLLIPGVLVCCGVTIWATNGA